MYCEQGGFSTILESPHKTIMDWVEIRDSIVTMVNGMMHDWRVKEGEEVDWFF
jgi:hypothetical protein